MKLNAFLICGLAMASSAGAQVMPAAATSDGAVVVERGNAVVAPGAGLPPIVVVSGSREAPTTRASAVGGSMQITGTTSGASRTATINPSGAQVDISKAQGAQPATIVRRGAVLRWTGQTEQCPAHYEGGVSYEIEERQTVVSAWTPTGNRRNYVNSCVATVVTRWNSNTYQCPYGHTGQHIEESEQSSTGGGPWIDTGNRRTVINSCTPTIQTQWRAESQLCSMVPPVKTKSWEAEYQSVALGPFNKTGNVRNMVDPCGQPDTQWVPRSEACPAGYTGGKSWEAEQVRATSASPYLDTGNTRNLSNTCSAPQPQVKFQQNQQCTWIYGGLVYEYAECTGSATSYQAVMAIAAKAQWPNVYACGVQDFYNGNEASGRCVTTISTAGVPASCTAGATYVHGIRTIQLNTGQGGGMNDADVDFREQLTEYVCR